MTGHKNNYAKPSMTKNGNVREITFSNVCWSCSLDDSSSDDSSSDHSSDSSS
ncbi:MAG: hypothetical protein ACYC57_00705 [Thermoleophilia bacterium]